MYVQCERCKAEYDFDDALVSERGTTVKCTNCGNQFKVRRAAQGAGAAEDRWVVTRIDGTEVVLTSLKELQRAILAKRVAKEDSLARTGSPPRRLESIAELEPFFTEKARAPSLPPEGARTPPPPRTSSRPPPPPGAPAPRQLSEPPRRSDLPPMRPRTPTLRPPDLAGAVPPPPPPPPDPAVHDPASEAPETLPVRRTGPPPPARTRSIPPPLPKRASQPAAIDVSSPLPPPAMRRSFVSELDEEPRADAAAIVGANPPPRRFLGWIVAVVLLGGAMIVGAFALRPYLAGHGGESTAGAGDPRVAALLTQGETALANGDIDAAQTSFDKASAFAEKDPKVLVDLARVANARADVAWLRQRLLPNESDAMQVNKKTLAELADRAKRAAEDASAVAPEDPAAIRVKLDALRIHDDRDAARALVGRLTGNAAAGTQPEVAYVLGALDLSELDPPWPEVLEHLRAAVAGEGNAGRARAALVYALARSGDAPRAREELERLSFLPRAHPLLAELRAFVDRGVFDGGAPRPSPSSSAALGSSSTGPTLVGVDSLPAAGGGGGGGGGGGVPTGDPRALLAQADAAKQRHDLPRARTLYDAALAKNPGDSEALAGLGDVSHLEKDLGGAQAFYKRAVAANPSFMPALIGLADVEWESGDRGAAQKAYKEIVDRFPEGSYPSYVHSRSEPAPAPTAAPAATATEGTAAPAPATSASGSASP